MIVIFVYTTNAYSNDAITINADTTYLKWNSTFPAISFCMFKPTSPHADQIVRKFVRKYYAQHNITEPHE